MIRMTLPKKTRHVEHYRDAAGLPRIIWRLDHWLEGLSLS